MDNSKKRCCAVCSKESDLRKCTGCAGIFYCGAQHQKQHWKVHQKDCVNFVIKDDPDRPEELGKGFFASRNIKAGTLILEEDPAVFAADCQPGLIPCLVCGGVFEEGKVRKCTKCAWPICSLSCENHDLLIKFWIHAENECEILIANNLIFPPPVGVNNVVVRNGILILRIYSLQKTRPTTFQELMDLQSDYSLPEKEDDVDAAGLEDPLWNYFQGSFNSVGLQTRNDVLKIRRIIGINSSLWIGAQIGPARILYVKASRINTSCVTNAVAFISDVPNYKLRVLAATDIAKGEPITLLPPHLTAKPVGTSQRQEYFRSIGRYICKCERCLDPTELGTYMSAIKCFVCASKSRSFSFGFYLPEDPLDLTDSAKWRCDRCDHRNINPKMLADTEHFDKCVEVLTSGFSSDDDGVNLVSLTASAEGLTARLSGIYHPNHFLIQTVKWLLFYRYSSDPASRNLSTVEQTVKIGQYLLSNWDKFWPGCSANRTYLLSLLTSALISQLQGIGPEDSREEQIVQQIVSLSRQAFNVRLQDFPKFGDGERQKHLYEDLIRRHEMYKDFNTMRMIFMQE